ncbi:MAG: DNA-processing protein DprA [Spirochaetales bacterium]|nr:DNA-processing protein DprA [Spirochaetales bacterium]
MAHREVLALALSALPALRPRERLLLLEACGGPDRLSRMGTVELAGLLGRSFEGCSWRPAEAVRWAEGAGDDLTRAGFVCTFYWEPAFPSGLREIYDPPLVLFWRGVPPAAQRNLVAIVGTRRPTGAARQRAYRLGFELARAGVGTVSGLARGIDAEAQRGTVDGGGYTIGVLGGGIDAVSPPSSRVLARRILGSGGALTSEYPPKIPAEAFHFPARNRIISALARSVVVVQAPARSGALITAEYALEHNRDLVVHAVGLCGEVGSGSRGLWQEGATVVRCGADVLAIWGAEAQVAAGAAAIAAGGAGRT